MKIIISHSSEKLSAPLAAAERKSRVGHISQEKIWNTVVDVEAQMSEQGMPPSFLRGATLDIYPAHPGQTGTHVRLKRGTRSWFLIAIDRRRATMRESGIRLRLGPKAQGWGWRIDSVRKMEGPSAGTPEPLKEAERGQAFDASMPF